MQQGHRSIGEETLKSEAYIDAFLKGKNPMHAARVAVIQECIAGEVKVAVTICLLAGGDALDLSVIFDITPGPFGTNMYNILTNWMKQPNLGGIYICINI